MVKHFGGGKVGANESPKQRCPKPYFQPAGLVYVQAGDCILYRQYRGCQHTDGFIPTFVKTRQQVLRIGLLLG